jgi:pectate lyase
VSTAAAFISAVQATAKSVIYVQGTLTIGEVRPKSNKSIIGLGTNATLLGVLTLGSSSSFGQVSNIIIRNLFINNPTGVGSGGGDGLTLQYGPTHIWVDHCTFWDNPDGQLDTSHAADYITYSWNKFYYTFDSGHNFVNLVGHSDSNEAEDAGTLRITWHHNWYSTLCIERMPRVRFGQNHVYNNYYGCSGNNYCIGLGCGSQVLAENNYFDNVSNPWKNYSSGCTQGLIHWNSGNVFADTTIPTWAPNSAVFTPPYTYTLEDGATVKDTVTTWAGAGVIQP